MGGETACCAPAVGADVVIWDSDPLELSSAPFAMYIDGLAQPMRSRQIEPRDRYSTPQEARCLRRIFAKQQSVFGPTRNV